MAGPRHARRPTLVVPAWEQQTHVRAWQRELEALRRCVQTPAVAERVADLEEWLVEAGVPR